MVEVSFGGKGVHVEARGRFRGGVRPGEQTHNFESVASDCSATRPGAAPA
jgi:hypothetical protein